MIYAESLRDLRRRTIREARQKKQNRFYWGVDVLLLTSVVIFDLGDIRETYLYDFAVGAFDFDTWGSEGLSGFHATNHAAHAFSIGRNNLNIVFSVKRLQCG